ncbi:MAG: hypothetical protein KDC98_03465 [Planctomycetes bacterium]|nr:hypothetical protein [Planctomycetota bacterium]
MNTTPGETLRRRPFLADPAAVSGFWRRTAVAAVRTTATGLGRSLFPLVTIALLLALPWIGPFWFLLAVFVWWRVVTVVA